jgi:hypothetical protein
MVSMFASSAGNKDRLNIYKPIIWEGENDKFASDICTIEFWVGLLCVSITKVCLTLEGYTLFGPFRVSTTKVCLKVTQMSKCFFLGPLCISTFVIDARNGPKKIFHIYITFKHTFVIDIHNGPRKKHFDICVTFKHTFVVDTRNGPKNV